MSESDLESRQEKSDKEDSKSFDLISDIIDKTPKLDSTNQLEFSIDENDLDKHLIEDTSYKIDDFIKKYEVDLRFLDNINENDVNETYNKNLRVKEIDYSKNNVRPRSEKIELTTPETGRLDTNENCISLFKSTSKSFSLLNTKIDEEFEDRDLHFLNAPLVSFRLDDSLSKINGSSQSFNSKNEVDSREEIYVFLNFVFIYFKMLKEGVEYDIVQRFCTKHIEKIKRYVDDINKFLPFPATPSEEAIKKSINFCEKSPSGNLKIN